MTELYQADELIIKGHRLVLTCGACPEQYDVYLGNENVGYLRLRHGRFTADAPFGNEIYEADTMKGDGIFEPDEREHFLNEAIDAIIAYYSPSGGD